MVIRYHDAFQHTHHLQAPIHFDRYVFILFQSPIDEVTAHIADGGETFVLEGPTPNEWIATDTTAEVIR